MKRVLSLLVMACVPATPARAYVDNAPSLGRVIEDASNIVVLEVEKVSKEKRVIIYKKVADLKGKHPGEQVKHQLTDGLHPREPKLILDWAEPGKTAVCFHNRKVSLICLGSYWYECAAHVEPWWTMTRGMPELSLSYFGSTGKLQNHVTDILAGKEVVITAVTHGTGGFRGYDAVIYKDLLRGNEHPVWRLRASLQMPGNVYHTASDPKFV